MTQSAIQFHLDECIPNHVAAGLRRLGRDCTTTHDVELRGTEDVVQLEYCRSHERVLVTRDADFLRLADDGHEHAGIVFWTEKRGVSQLIRDIDTTGFQATPHRIRNTVLYA
ncbi:DUF5615 family PIN-like protein [Stieleria magnilauensis]|uniref:DUF5615 family PIN-like protein n=1 Tax=Stieleria magnilauensis TaxID=2527963 RepID=UPI0011A9979D